MTTIPLDYITKPYDNPFQVQEYDFRNLPLPFNWETDLSVFQRHHNLCFRNTALLKGALIHSSYLQHYLKYVENDRVPLKRMCNRSYETLGDSILGMVVSSYVFQANQCALEGEVTKVRSSIVNNEMLARICVNHLKMHQLVLAIDTDFTPNGLQTIHAGAVESLVGAIFLDRGVKEASEFVSKHILTYALTSNELRIDDPISQLQIEIQKFGELYPKPEYRKCGPGCIDLYFKSQLIGTGRAESYKKARFQAAEQALKVIHQYIQ